MKKNLIISCFIMLGIINSHASDFRNYNTMIPVQDTIVGFFEFDQLQTSPYITWFEPEYETYIVDQEALDQIDKELLSQIKITIVIGTWCSDSKRETPRFVKIIEYLKIKDITAIGVNRAKKAPNTPVDNLEIDFVPTIIFYLEEKEIGRIIESPTESLEKDMLTIFSAL